MYGKCFAQYFYHLDWLNNKVKAYYYGPRISWMKLLDKPRKKKNGTHKKNNKRKRR